MAEKKASPVVYSGGKDRPDDRRDPNEVPLVPTPAELDPLDNEHHYKSPEHEQKPEYEDPQKPPEVVAGGTSEPYSPQPAEPGPKPVSTSEPYNPKEPTRA